MNTKTLFKLVGIILFSFVLTACQQMKDVNKPFKHNTPLIKTDVKEFGKAELEKDAKMGPVPVEADVIKLQKRKKISSVK